MPTNASCEFCAFMFEQLAIQNLMRPSGHDVIAEPYLSTRGALRVGHYAGMGGGAALYEHDSGSIRPKKCYVMSRLNPGAECLKVGTELQRGMRMASLSSEKPKGSAPVRMCCLSADLRIVTASRIVQVKGSSGLIASHPADGAVELRDDVANIDSIDGRDGCAV